MNPDLFGEILAKIVKTGYVTIDELCIILDNPDSAKAFTKFLAIYSEANPMLKNVVNLNAIK